MYAIKYFYKTALKFVGKPYKNKGVLDKLCLNVYNKYRFRRRIILI